MDCSFILEYEGMSIYECSKRSGIAYSTLSDIIKGRTPIEKVSACNLQALAKTLDMSMDDLYAQMHVPKRIGFENFKSEVCHRLRERGDMNFIVDTLSSSIIRNMFNWRWYPECLYLLAMLDYISKENGIALCGEYDDIRTAKLSEIIYPASVLAMCIAANNDKAKEEALKKAIPEFLKYNIVESEVRNVI